MNLSAKKTSILKRAMSLALLYSFVFTNIAAVGAFASNRNETPSAASAITSFTTDLTQLGRDGRLRENLNLENETIRLMQVLVGGGKRQPVIVDEKAENQDFIVEQLAIRIANESVHNKLTGVSILKLETDSLFSSSSNASETSARIASVIDAVISSNNKSILFVDDLTSVLEAGKAGEKLVEAIKSGKLTIIGGSSKAAFDEKIATKPEIADLFATILVSDSASKAASANVPSTSNGYRGDNVSSDLREMMAQDPT
ncbi:MAG: hypothetical protein AAB288_12125, partial [Acidobacteriota bacterium]